METQTMVLRRLHSTTVLLRRAARISQLSKKLQGADPLVAARILSELVDLYKDPDLKKLKILEMEEKQMKKQTALVERKALKIIEEGLNSLSADKVSMGMQIMAGLGITEAKVQHIVDDWLVNAEQYIRKALNAELLISGGSKGGAGRISGMTIPENVVQFRNALWDSWDKTLNSTIYSMCARVALIQNVLNSSDFENESCGLHKGPDDKSEMAFVFWSQIDELMTKHLTLAAKNSSDIRMAFEREYPKLLQIHLELHTKLKALNTSVSQDRSTKPIFPSRGKSIKQFENAYLSRFVKVMFDNINGMFPKGELPAVPPSTEKVDNFVKMIHSELSTSLVDESLTSSVAGNVAKSISLFCQNCEQLLNNSADATQVIKPLTPSQELNVEVANISFYLTKELKYKLKLLAIDEESAATYAIIMELSKADNFTQQIINNVLAAIIVAIESILLTMHNENYDLTEYNGSTSLYMRELQTFISRAVSTYLSPFHNQLQVSNACMEVSTRAIELFLRHTALLRPLSDAGRRKLITDFDNFEEAIFPLCNQLNELGRVYSSFRSIRPLIMASPVEIASSPVLGEVIPFSLAIMFLFSKGPPELPSPHESADWSIAQLSKWLDKHPNEKDRLELLSGAVKKYEVKICNQNKPSFHDIYPTMKGLLEKAAKFVTSNEELASLI